MAIKVALHDESGAPFVSGLGVELLRLGAVVETAYTDEHGTVTFAQAGQGPFAIRMQATDALATPKPPEH